MTPGVGAATIGGGGNNLTVNRVTDLYGTVSGGVNNQAGDGAGATNDRLAATVGGGSQNMANGAYATVAGGRQNSAGGQHSAISGGQGNLANGFSSFIGGGELNVASSVYSAVAGGNLNAADGPYSFVAGGEANMAGGSMSFAGGNHAQAIHDGAFVWSDRSFGTFASTATDQFNVRASGGFRFATWGDASTGVTLAAGGGAWVSISDRNAKANFVRVDGRRTLERLASIPISTWNYKTQDKAIRHMGPMAQDFHAAFKVGETETGINTVDADGVALSAIQGLYEIVQEKEARIARLEAEVASLRKVEARLAALERALGLSPATERVK